MHYAGHTVARVCIVFFCSFLCIQFLRSESISDARFFRLFFAPQNDLLGQSLLNLTHPEDQAFLKRQLIPTDLERLFGPQPEDENGEPRARTAEEEAGIDQKLKEDKRNFTIRLVFFFDFIFIAWIILNS